MPEISNRYIRSYISEMHTGPKPSVFDRLAWNRKYASYNDTVAKIRDHLSEIDDVQELIAVLTNEYGLPRNRALDFVHDNASERYRRADDEGKQAIRKHQRGMFAAAFEKLNDDLEAALKPLHHRPEK